MLCFESLLWWARRGRAAPGKAARKPPELVRPRPGACRAGLARPSDLDVGAILAAGEGDGLEERRAALFQAAEVAAAMDGGGPAPSAGDELLELVEHIQAFEALVQYVAHDRAALAAVWLAAGRAEEAARRVKAAAQWRSRKLPVAPPFQVGTVFVRASGEFDECHGRRP